MACATRSTAPCAGRCAAPTRSAACSAAGSIPRRFRRWPRARSPKRTSGSPPSPACRGAASTAPCRAAPTPTKRLMSRRSDKRAPERSTSPMSATTNATTSPSSSGFSSRSKGRCAIRPISAGCWAMLRLARAQGRRVLLGGLYGNSTISWNGWSQAAGHLKRGRLLTAARQWRQFYRRTPYSRWVAMRKLLLEPLVPRRLGDWAETPPPPCARRALARSRRYPPRFRRRDRRRRPRQKSRT